MPPPLCVFWCVLVSPPLCVLVSPPLCVDSFLKRCVVLLCGCAVQKMLVDNCSAMRGKQNGMCVKFEEVRARSLFFVRKLAEFLLVLQGMSPPSF